MILIMTIHFFKQKNNNIDINNPLINPKNPPIKILMKLNPADLMNLFINLIIKADIINIKIK